MYTPMTLAQHHLLAMNIAMGLSQTRLRYVICCPAVKGTLLTSVKGSSGRETQRGHRHLRRCCDCRRIRLCLQRSEVSTHPIHCFGRHNRHRSFPRYRPCFQHWRSSFNSPWLLNCRSDGVRHDDVSRRDGYMVASTGRHSTICFPICGTCFRFCDWLEHMVLQCHHALR